MAAAVATNFFTFPNEGTLGEIKAIAQAKTSRDQAPSGSIPMHSAAHEAQLAVGEYSRALARENCTNASDEMASCKVDKELAAVVDEDLLVDRVRAEADSTATDAGSALHAREAARHLAKSRQQDITLGRVEVVTPSGSAATMNGRDANWLDPGDLGPNEFTYADVKALSQAKMARDAQTGDLPLGSGGHSASRAAGKYAAGLAEQNATHPIIEQESIKIGREWADTVDEDELIARVAQEASMAEPDAVGDTAEAAIHLADSRAVDLAL